MAGNVTPDPAAPTMTWEQHHEAGRRRFAEGDAAGAEQAFRAAIAAAEQSGGDPLQRASSLSSLGQLKYQQKDYKGAEDAFRQSLELREAALGADHPTVISGINNLAALFVARGALDEAEPLLQRAMAVTVKRVEATQAELAVNLNNLVRLYVKRSDYARAEPLVVRLLALKRPLGPEHPEVAAVLVTLAKLRQSMGQPEAAERLWRRVLGVRQRTLAANDQLLASTLDGLADACAAQGKAEEELSARERSLAVRTAAGNADAAALDAQRARVAALRQALPAGRRTTPGAARPAAAGSPPAADPGMASGVSGLTGVIPNVIPEALALTRAMNEQAAKAGQSQPERAAGRPTPGASTASKPTPRGSRPPGAAVSPADKPRPTPIPELRRPTPIPELETQSALESASAPGRPSGGTSAASPTREPKTGESPGDAEGVKWVEPASVVPTPPPVRARPQRPELTKPKLKMGTQARESATASPNTLWYAAALAIVACGGIAWYVHTRWFGQTVSTVAPAPHPVAHHPPPGMAKPVQLPPPLPVTPPTTQASEGGTGVAGVSATSGPYAGMPPEQTGMAAPQERPAPSSIAAATSGSPPPPPVHVFPVAPTSAKPAASGAHSTGHPAKDSSLAMPAAINLDAASRAIDSSVKARHSP